MSVMCGITEKLAAASGSWSGDDSNDDDDVDDDNEVMSSEESEYSVILLAVEASRSLSDDEDNVTDSPSPRLQTFLVNLSGSALDL